MLMSKDILNKIMNEQIMQLWGAECIILSEFKNGMVLTYVISFRLLFLQALLYLRPTLTVHKKVV